MNEHMQSVRTGTPSTVSVPLPINAWWSGFDYVFGYQIKLVQQFWGIPSDSGDA